MTALEATDVSSRSARSDDRTPLPASTLFRFATAGSVDDGKSTLVGRLLHDSKAILADQLEQVARTSAERGFAHGAFDFALLTDGLRAEREQGITIDVAYRYFSTGNRSFILADCPGHVQYTRNMVTGATTADAVIVLIDGRKGVLEQTRRHLAVIALLRVPHVIVAVNKIDLLDYAEDAFAEVAAQVEAVTAELGIDDVHVIPVSALEGDNIVERSARTPWYDGPALLELLEALPGSGPAGLGCPGVPPARAARPASAGRPVPGGLRRRRRVAPRLPGLCRPHLVGQRARRRCRAGLPVRHPHDRLGDRRRGRTGRAGPPHPQSVSVQLADDVDAARGAVIVAAGTLPEAQREIDAELFQLDARPLLNGARVLVKHGTATVQAIVAQIDSRYDLDALSHEPADELAANDIGRVRLRLAAGLPLEPYSVDRAGGSFLVIHPSDGATLAAGITRD